MGYIEVPDNYRAEIIGHFIFFLSLILLLRRLTSLSLTPSKNQLKALFTTVAYGLSSDQG